MFNRKNKRKLAPEEKARQKKLEAEQKRRGSILKEKLYPLLVEETTSIQDVQIFVQTMATVIEGAFAGLKKNTDVQFLKLRDDMKQSPEAERYKKILDILEPEKVDVAIDLLQSMGNLITNNLRREQSQRKLSDLPIEFITYNNE